MTMAKGIMIVDGQRVPFDGEKNVLSVIRKAGIDMPTFCYYSELSVHGACRMCIVENVKTGKIDASCSMEPRDGLEIRTNTARLLRHRRMILELMLASHDCSCTTCAKSGNCRLQALAQRFGVSRVRFPDTRERYEQDNTSLAIFRDPNKCILCGDCVRVCEELQGQGILNYALSLFGITGPHWLIDASTALTGILFLTAWRVVGYAMMIYLSAMKGIPQDYYEAAVIDGADGVQRFRYITVPLLAPTSLFLFVTTFIASMKVFQSVDVMTGGGPGTATNVMVQWIYNLTFKDFRTARGAAVSLVFFVILLVCTVATMRFSNKNVNYDA